MALTAEQLARLPQALQDNYNRTRLDLVEIDGEKFSSYSTFTYYEAKTYVKSPTRSQTGAMGNLNSYATFVTPRLKISFNYMDIDVYRRLIQLINSKNEFTVTCYDVESDTRVTNKMYFSPNDYPEIYQQKLKVLGLLNYEIELVGTNNDLDYVSLTYNANTTDTVSQMPTSREIPKNTNVVIGNGLTPTRSGYEFVKWGTSADGSTFNYLNGEEYLIYKNTTLYAIWRASV